MVYKDKVLIAGSFGFHLTAASLTAIGLLPEETAGRIEFVRNTAKSGGEAFLLNRDIRGEMADLVREITVVELANCRDFDKSSSSRSPFKRNGYRIIKWRDHLWRVQLSA